MDVGMPPSPTVPCPRRSAEPNTPQDGRDDRTETPRQGADLQVRREKPNVPDISRSSRSVSTQSAPGGIRTPNLLIRNPLDVSGQVGWGQIPAPATGRPSWFFRCCRGVSSAPVSKIVSRHRRRHRERGSLCAGGGPASLETSSRAPVSAPPSPRAGSGPCALCESRAWGPCGRWLR
jgi:hypothetical protein